ncbi:pentapeptide repeat-containing protein [Sinisalibacter lacisalsi]|uniref:Pentapeptide repeat-containing protein n=1 Tax=Sinisalibacter lacisalsi TaxID=1526570 RepID=A0ABQ1QTP6_9RHOB|nr:pentapeptide repeat-containing protein [Sinisalibacter lacisalsi]GGD41588.1 hypothetical protein GCM10011358_26830 [Sinisalibacter lacisalsi]
MSAENNKKSLSDWLGLQWKPDYDQNRAWGRILGFAIQVVAAILVLLGLGLLIAFAASVYKAISAGTEMTGEAIRNVGLALAAVFGAPFLVWRSLVAQRQTDIAEQSQITDRINKAVENLAATRVLHDAEGRQFTEPNLEVRIGAIYALERIAQDSLRDHVQIMEILTAYVRENAKAEDAEDSPRARWRAAFEAPEVQHKDNAAKAAYAHQETDLTDATSLEAIRDWARSLKCRTDIQAALTVIGRRSATQIERETADTRQSDKGFRLDLLATNLQGADLSNLDFKSARLSGAHLEGAKLNKAHMEGSDLFKAHMEGADLFKAHLEGADLFGAHLEEAVLLGTHLDGANLSRAHLEGSDLRWAQLDHATSFTKAVMTHAAVKNVDLSNIRLSADQINAMFGDGTVTLPEAILRPPAHWPSDDLRFRDFDAKWTLYKSNPTA